MMFGDSYGLNRKFIPTPAHHLDPLLRGREQKMYSKTFLEGILRIFEVSALYLIMVS